MKSFEFVPHTADIAVKVRASTEEGLFEAAAEATTEALTDAAAVRPANPRLIELESTELELLLVDWLHELLFLFETEGFLLSKADVTISRREGAYALLATAWGERWDESRHPLKLLIKAVTYHGLQVSESAEGLSATVVFDI